MLAIEYWWHRLWVPAVLSCALVLIEPEKARAEPAVPVPPNGLLTDQAEGTVSAADRDLVIKVRLAGLWEIPAGDMAQEKSDDPEIQKIGRSIATQHAALDELARAAAKKLKIDLPSKPNSDQQSWLAEMRDAEGAEFDQIYIDRLRAAHGKIFPAIATVRSSTRNDTVRKLAQQTNQFVMTHLTLLESSGIVDYRALPTAPAPSAAASQPADTGRPADAGQALASADVSQTSKTSTPLVIAVLAAGLIAGTLATRFFMGNRRRTYRPRRDRHFGF